jgi:hypothetical protein
MNHFATHTAAAHLTAPAAAQGATTNSGTATVAAKCQVRNVSSDPVPKPPLTGIQTSHAAAAINTDELNNIPQTAVKAETLQLSLTRLKRSLR